MSCRGSTVRRAGQCRLHSLWLGVQFSCFQAVLRAAALGLAIASGSIAAIAEDWPQWRGPNSNAVSVEADLPAKWSADEGILWKTELPGSGTSSPVIWKDRVVVTAADGPRNSDLHVICLAITTGQIQWHTRLWGTAPTLYHGTKSDMATPTPVIDGQFVYAMFGTGDLFCLDMKGNLVWHRSLATEYGAFENRFGYTSSPVGYRDLILLQCDHYGDSYLLAVEKATGANRWKLDRPGTWHSWSSPRIVPSTQPKGDELIVCGAGRVDGIDPIAGKPLWTVGGMQRECIPTPVFGHGMILAVSGPKGTTLAIRPGGHGDVSETHVYWRNTRGAPFVPSPIVVGDFYCVVDDRGIMTAVDALSGNTRWQHRLRGSFTASPIAGDGKIYLTNEDGETVVIEANGRAYKELSRNALAEPVYASPAIANQCLFIRTARRLCCIDGVGL